MRLILNKVFIIITFFSCTFNVNAQNIPDTDDVMTRSGQAPQPGWSNLNGSCDCSNQDVWGYDVTIPWAGGPYPPPIPGHTYFLSCGKFSTGEEGASGTITGLTVGQSYNFTFYVAGFRSDVAMSSNGSTYRIVVGNDDSGVVLYNSNNWILQSFTFIADGTSETIEVYGSSVGDWTMTHFSFESSAVAPTCDATVSSNNTICQGDDAIFTFNGTSNATVIYNINGGANQAILLDALGNADLILSGVLINQIIELTSVTEGFCTSILSNIDSVIVIAPTIASITGTVAVCQGDTDPILTFIAGNGTAPYTFTYTINGGPNQTVASIGNTATVSVPANASGTFIYELTSLQDASSTNCSQLQITSATVTVNSLPIIDAGTDLAVCNDGTQVTLTGMGAATYIWNNGVTDNTAFLSPLGTTTYSVTGADGNGCTNTDQVDVLVNALPIIDAGTDLAVCDDGTQVTLTGMGGATYLWNSGVTDNIAFLSPLGTTTYSVTGTDGNGCTNTDQVDVLVNALPIIDAGSDQVVCNDGTQVTLTGMGGAIYLWNNGITDNTAFLSPPGTTTYSVTGIDGNGCVNTDQVDVLVNALPIIDAGSDQVVCNDGTQVTLTGMGAATYLWNNSITDNTAFLSPLGTTTYSVTGTDGNGCTNTDQVDVLVNSLPEASFFGDVVFGCAPLEVNFEPIIIDNTNMYEWIIADDTLINSSNTYLFNDPGLFDVALLVTSIYGCESLEMYTDYIFVDEVPEVEFSPEQLSLTTLNTAVQFTNSSCCGVTYCWNFGDASALSYEFHPFHTFPNNAAGSYNVELIGYSLLGCSDTAQAIINITDELLYYVPNTFTPDNDNYNQTFLPVFTEGFDPYDFDLFIFNRWGEVIWESHDSSVGWDGTYNGRLVQNGMYTWKIEFTTTNNDERKFTIGHINVLY
jgi:gliding motility-associated-like protein